jgi:hypothetical protein
LLKSTNFSNTFSGWSCLAPEAFTPPIDVPATMSIFILLFARALKIPHPNAPKEPQPWSTSTFSMASSSDITEFYQSYDL